MTSWLSQLGASTLARAAVAACLICLLVSGMVVAHVSPDAIVHEGERLILALRDLGPKGIVWFAALQILIALVGIVPASLSAIAAGMVYGTLAGFLLSVVTTMFAAYLAFVLSRSLFRPGIARLISRHTKVRSLDQLVAAEGWKFVCLLRISPLMPFSATSYMLGLSKIGLKDYLIGTLASLPALLGYVAMGRLTNDGLAAWTQGDSPVRWFIFLFGGLATVALGVWLVQTVTKLSVTTP